jgi:SAM-dependent methyltransferase
MKFSESSEPVRPRITKESLVSALGGTEKMSEEEKLLYLQEKEGKIFQNIDFVSQYTYRDIFTEIDLNGKNMALVGAGYSVGVRNEPSPLMASLMVLNPKVNLIPVDMSEERLKSWHILDTEHSNIEINPVATDGLKLPFKDESIEVYSSVNLINEPREKMAESVFVKNLINEGYRVLVPGGSMLLSSFGYILYKQEDGTAYFNDKIDADEMVSPIQIESYLRNAGFREVKKLPLKPELIELFEKEKSKVVSDKKGIATEIICVDPCAFQAIK